MTETDHIVVVGLGYVGLPLAIALARSFDVTGIDIDVQRVDELRAGKDRTNEVSSEALGSSTLKLCSDPSECELADFYIITVPTPVDSANQPDLRPVLGATEAVARMIQPGRKPIIVYESTVYPGVTEEICGPLIERLSGLARGSGFYLGYSPERINPGDREHTVDRIVKVIAGESVEVVARLEQVYDKVTSAGVFKAKSIKAAEAAKVIENAQRDINIAFMNEITQIFSKLDISIWDVLETAATKWNFLPFQPGLVGGHCIGVDPYYLSFRAQQLGHQPDVILAGRTINDGMGRWVADRLHQQRGGAAGSVLVMGLTFKEDVPDLRNSRVVDVVRRLRELGHEVTVHDPHADPTAAIHELQVELDSAALSRTFDLVVGAVPHAQYRALGPEQITSLVRTGGCVADLKGMWRHLDLGTDVDRWTL